MKYNIIYADPAWHFSSRLRNGSPSANGTINVAHRKLSETYSTMKTSDICNIPVSEICAQDCALFIWTTDAHLEDCLKVIKSWGV